MLFLKQPLILPFLCHKSATICKIDSNDVSSSKLKSDLCSCVKSSEWKLRLLHSNHTIAAQFFFPEHAVFGLSLVKECQSENSKSKYASNLFTNSANFTRSARIARKSLRYKCTDCGQSLWNKFFTTIT